MRYIALLSIGFALTGFLHASLLAAEAEATRPADAFVDFVGVNTHLGYFDTTYGDDEGILKFLGNMHPYAAGNPPSRHWGWGLSMERAIAEARKMSGDKPILVTECGYHNRVENQGHPGASEAAEAKYLPRLWMENQRSSGDQ